MFSEGLKLPTRISHDVVDITPLFEWTNPSIPGFDEGIGEFRTLYNNCLLKSIH
jgi:hypothetical protein